MRLAALEIQNFRCIDRVRVEFPRYTCLVGPNGAGKSTILAALNVLFRSYEAGGLPSGMLGEEDFHHRNVDEPIIVTATFDSLSADAVATFASYVRHDRLTIRARAYWNSERGHAEVKQYGARLAMADFAPYFKASGDGAKVADLKDIYEWCRTKYSELPTASTKAAMESALREFEEGHSQLCELLDSEDQFYGWSKGANRLAEYIQWVYIPAVKDASTEQDEGKNTALGQLLERAVGAKTNFDGRLAALRAEATSQYAIIVEEEQPGLESLSRILERRLQSWAHPGAQVQIRWHHDPAKSIAIHLPLARAKVGEDEFLGDLCRLGHGLQRSFIVSLLQELASENGSSGPTLLLGFEEPELYQHPPQARHLAAVLEELAEKDAQVIVTTHSPLFVSSKGFESVRMVRKTDASDSVITSMSYDELSRAIGEALGEPPATKSVTMTRIEQIMQPSQNEMYFARRLVLVEGIEDVAFISTHLHLTDRWSEFRRLGLHFVVGGGKTNLSRPLAIAKGFGVPAFVVFDGDAKAENPEGQRRDNRCVLTLSGHSDAEPLPDSTFWGERAVMWFSNIGDSVRDDVGEELWDGAEQTAREEFGLTQGVKRKNNMLISATLEVLQRGGTISPVLDRLCEAILLLGERDIAYDASDPVAAPADSAGELVN
jgi:putative ATP-dependent endonuclease of the OLD family